MSDPRPPDPPAALDQIVDDDTPRREALDWAAAELTAGRPFDDVLADLLAAGWPDADAADLLELARRQTRAQRGVRTREQVVADANRTYRRAMTLGWFLGLPTVAAAMRLLYALGNLLTLRGPRDERSGHKSSNDNA
jgi:hypothetical protein